jgi:hypothetical protein
MTGDGIHRLSDVDPDTMTGTCEVCGSGVQVYNAYVRKGKQYFQCAIKKREEKSEQRQALREKKSRQPRKKPGRLDLLEGRIARIEQELGLS